jgi:hypothetical protein
LIIFLRNFSLIPRVVKILDAHAPSPSQASVSQLISANKISATIKSPSFLRAKNLRHVKQQQPVAVGGAGRQRAQGWTRVPEPDRQQLKSTYIFRRFLLKKFILISTFHL